MNKALCICLLFLLGSHPTKADDGMWLLALLKKYNAEELKNRGLRIPVEELSGEAPGALSETVVAFGSGCTGSIISKNGLIITNYHCSYNAIQQHDNPQLNMYGNGFWAATNLKELPIADLKITINKRIIDVTGEVKKLLPEGFSVASFQAAVKKIADTYQKQFPAYRINTKIYRNKSIIVLYVQQQYEDVRLVGVAPKIIAKFGGETDNWMWPRHSADFAFFRVYASQSGKPAKYSRSNIPLSLDNYLPISTAGYNKGDFAMSLGYPAMSNRNATSAEVWEKVNVYNPPLLAVRKTRQTILENEMAASNDTRLSYAEKYAASANYYKNASGMNYWVNRLAVIGKKEAFEENWLTQLEEKNGNASVQREMLASIQKGIKENADNKRALMYFSEGFFTACDMIRFINGFGQQLTTYAADVKKSPVLKKDMLANIYNYYKSYNVSVDRQVTIAVMALMLDSIPHGLLPDIYGLNKLDSKDAIEKYVRAIYTNSVFSDSLRLKNWLKNPTGDIGEDPALLLVASIEKKHKEVFKNSQRVGASADRNAAAYDAAVTDYSVNKYYPDADRTIRLSYGTVTDLKLDTSTIPFQTMFSELIGKSERSGHVKDYLLHPLLSGIWKNKDWKKYGQGTDFPVCFITNGDVTGGNSGSPMLNAKGEMIGLVFDCNWESMTREFNYDEGLHRVICADIRYIFMLAEKCSGSTRLSEEAGFSH